MVCITDFPSDDRARIERAVDEVWHRLRTADLPPPLRRQLLDLFHQEGRLEIRNGRGEGLRGAKLAWAFRGRQPIHLNRVLKHRNRLAALILHEAVHTADRVEGTEFHAEVVEVTVFPDRGTHPTKGDYPKFCKRTQPIPGTTRRGSTYYIWDTKRGYVWRRGRSNRIRGMALLQHQRWVLPQPCDGCADGD